MKTIKFSNVFIVDKDNKILILRRTNSHPTRPLALDLPGGGLEEGEDFVTAVIREVKEETNIELNPKDLKLIRCRKLNLPERGLEGAIFIARIVSNNVRISLSEEHDEYYWVGHNALKNLPEFHQDSLDFALKNKFLN